MYCPKWLKCTVYLQVEEEGWNVLRGIRISPAMARNLTQLALRGICSDDATSGKS